MGGQGLQRGRRWRVQARFLGCAVLLISATASAGSRNDNFAQTVGGDVASLAKQQHVDRAARSGRNVAKSASVECDLCVAPTTDIQWRQDHSLDQRLRSQYRQMGEELASKLWDDPRGRRIKFDIEGKPGLGLEIPLD